MKIGLPKEIMSGEGRVALTPSACQQLVAAGHDVYLQHEAGEQSAYSDAMYQQAGVEVVADAQQLYEQAQLIVKVKQPLQQDIQYLRSDHVLFGYLHLAADVELIQTLCSLGPCVIPFESVTDDEGNLPLLAPMSQVAGRISVIRGASLLFRNRGGRGVLLGGVDGSDTGRVLVLGAGVAGSNAVASAVAMGAQVDVLDINDDKLDQLKQRYSSITTHHSTAEVVAELCMQADLVIGAVLLAGRRAPVVLPQSVVRQMQPGSVIVDIAIDQGGCVENIRATTSEQLCYTEHGVIHSAVPNMPAAVSRTSSQSLSTAILPYVLELASGSVLMQSDSVDIGLTACASKCQALRQAMAICHGEVVDPVLSQEFARESLAG